MQFGLGLRSEHYQSILEQKPKIDWFEIISEDYMVDGGLPLYYLDKIRQDYPMSLHGVSLSIGSTDPLNWDYLKRLKALADHIKPLWISDHLCWTGVQGINTHDLMPLPYTDEAIDHVVMRIKQVQDYLGQQLVLENVSSYVSYAQSVYSEVEFLVRVVERADCLILLDINNIYVSAFNHGFKVSSYLAQIPAPRVKQFHLAGHKSYPNYIIDTHDNKIDPNVMAVYAEALKHFGPVPTSIERDDNIPVLNELLLEMDQVRYVADQVLSVELEAQ